MLNTGAVFLAILCIWPADGGLPKIAFAQAPSMEVCQASNAIEKGRLEADQTVRYVSTSCVELVRGEKS